ncbi:MAG: hypothetical protein PHV68_08840, partial [Candidatus Gastranaerophilales bacterium]|nr:hypothetical protein [Candidatus Gastranaerophilales bacterium]
LIEAVDFYNECRPNSVNWAGLIYLPATAIIEHGFKFKTIKKEDLKKINVGTFQPISLYHRTSLFDRSGAKDKEKFINISAFMLLFALIPVFPKSFVKFLLKNKFYNLSLTVPNVVIILFKIISKIKNRQIYLYTDSLKISFANKIQKIIFNLFNK